jgi:alpha-ketoglutarate-dependent taurine dioxygenase
MKISKIPGLGRFGIFIDDLDLNKIGAEEWMKIGELHLNSLVTILRNVSCTKERYAELINQWGDIRTSAYLSKKYKTKYGQTLKWVLDQVKQDSSLIDEADKFRVKAAQQITEITKNNFALMKVAGGYTNGVPNGMFAEGDLEWHSNESGTLTFVPGVALMGWNNMIGSSTGFLTTVDYYESVSNSFRSELDDMVIVHKFTPGKINPGAPDDQDLLMHANMCPEDCEIPLVIKSPGGIQGLHYSINTINHVKGATEEESQKIFQAINKELLTDKYMYDHWYQQNNDICLFDNTITQHRRLGYIDGRLAYRLPFDYTNLQAGPYMPYQQEPYRSQYISRIHEIVKLLNNKTFKLPKRTFKSYFVR